MVARLNLLSLDGTELSDHGRTYSADRVPKIVELELANGDRKQYVKAIKRKFHIDWHWLPDASAQTSDGKAGRDVLRGLCFDGNTHTLIVRDMAGGTTNTYTVYVDGYTENIERRDISGTYFYDISLELTQK